MVLRQPFKTETMPKATCHAALTYRPLTVADLPAAQRLSSGLGWPHNEADWRFTARTGLGIVAEDERGVVGTALCWKFGDDYASVGMVTAANDTHADAIKHELMRHLQAEIGDRSAVLYATQDNVQVYESLGYTVAGLVYQYQGAAFQPPQIFLPRGERLRPLGTSDMPRLIELASLASGQDRSTFMPSLLNVAKGIGIDHDGELTGFALFRRFGRGYTIGPVIVLDDDDCRRAQALISYWLARNVGTLVRIDLPKDSELSSWVAAAGLPHVDSVVKMVRNGVPTPDPRVRQYAITSHSIG